MENLIELIGMIVITLFGIITNVTTAVSTVRTKSKFFNNTFSMFDNKIANINTTVNSKVADVKDVVVIKLTSIETSMNNFVNKTADKLIALEAAYIKQEETAKEQVKRLEGLEQENKLFRELIVTLTGENPELIRKGIASKIKTLNEDFNEDFKDGKEE